MIEVRKNRDGTAIVTQSVAPAEAGAQFDTINVGPGLRRGDRLRIYCGAVAIFANLDHRRFQK